MPQQQLVSEREVTQYVDAHPKATMEAVAAHFGVSRATVIKRLSRGAGGRPIKLTDHDRKVFYAIIDYIEQHGWAPSVTDIADAVPCARSSAHNSMHRLAATDNIVLGDGPRAIRVVGSEVNMNGVDRDAR